MLRTSLYADPQGRFVHDLIFDSCRRVPQKTALVDTSCGRRISYAEYGEVVESLARSLVAAGLKPGEVGLANGILAQAQNGRRGRGQPAN